MELAGVGSGVSRRRAELGQAGLLEPGQTFYTSLTGREGVRLSASEAERVTPGVAVAFDDGEVKDIHPCVLVLS